MSEKIYAWLLRLYPAQFRTAYGDEALQLFRDRAHDEHGLFAQIRLWLELLVDLAISVPREYRYVQPAVIATSGTPAFHVLKGDTLHLRALFYQGMLSLITFGSLPLLISHGRSHGSIHFGVAMAQVGVKWEHAERVRVIDAVVANLRKYYINADLAAKMADALLAHQNSGEYDAVTDGAAFADLLTRQIRDVSHDMHLVVVYSQDALPDRSPGPPPPEALNRYRKALEAENCTFERVKILPHNIGYLKLNSFPDTSICQATATAAMASLNHADAIIFDLRDNRGGYPNMVALLAAYLFDHPEYLYNPRENTTQQSWTVSPVPGNKLADKPVYVLTSGKTISGAEQFCYDLKMLKRATLVGETTSGSAHSGNFHRIDDHFGMGIPETRPINPFSKIDWEGTGVEPDVRVNAADAPATAEKLANNNLRKKD